MVVNMKIDLKYLKNNFDLKKFLNKIYKNKTDWDNTKVIFDILMECCSNQTISAEELSDKIYEDDKLFDKIEDGFLTGKIFEVISDNFRLLKSFYISEPKTSENKYIYDQKHHAFSHHIINSKVDGKVYVIVHQFWDYTNDGYYCRERFSLQKDAIKFVKNEHKLLKKNFMHYCP